MGAIQTAQEYIRAHGVEAANIVRNQIAMATAQRDHLEEDRLERILQFILVLQGKF